MPSTELLTIAVEADVEPARATLATLCPPRAGRECPMSGTDECPAAGDPNCPSC